MKDFEESLFRTWQSGNEDARGKIWSLLWATLYSVAWRYCRSFCMDDFTADEIALNAFGKTWKEMEQLVSRGEVEWQGQGSFICFVRNRLINRCRDECRSSRRVWKSTVSLDAQTSNDDEEGIPLLDLLELKTRSPEEKLLAVEKFRLVVRLIAAAREMYPDRVSLVEILKQIEEYLRQQLISTLPPEANVAIMTLDDLSKAAVLDDLEVKKGEMYKFLMDSLGINRNTLDQRMKYIRTLLSDSRLAEDD